MRNVIPCTLAALGVVGCFDATSPGAPRPGAVLRASVQPSFTAWSAPVNLGPVINTAASEQHPAISADGLSLYFSSDRPGGAGALDIWVSRRAGPGQPWGDPVNLGPEINSVANDLAPNLRIDGRRLFFHSARVGGCGGQDLYVARRRYTNGALGWHDVQNLGCVINSAADDAGPSYVQDEAGSTVLYFTSTRPGGQGDFDIYKSVLLSDGTWGPGVAVPELNSPFRDTRTAIRHDALEMILSSDVTGRVGGIGGQDLWVSTRPTTSDPWSTPVNLGPTVNSTAFDGAPALSFDGTELYFFSARPGGFGGNDLYVSTRSRR